MPSSLAPQPPIRPVPPRRQVLARLALIGLGATPLAALLAACSPTANDPLRVNLEEGRQLFASRQVLLVDVREPREHAGGVADGALLVPMSQMNRRMNEIPKDPAQPVLIICNTQNRSSRLVRSLNKAGWHNVRYVHGGMSAWARNGWPMVRPL